jgi:hypothetical protein
VADRVRIVATYKRRDEPDELIADLQANLAPWVDGFVELQTPRTGPWPHEGQALERQRQLVRREYGETWVLFIDPDERIEDQAVNVVREAIARAAQRGAGRQTQFQFPLCEMWTPTQWRKDGDWGTKKPRTRLFHLHPGQRFRDKPIHCGVAPVGPSGNRVTLPAARMYHLKNIEPDNRRARAQAYLDADPKFEHQRREGRDWSWLYDETYMELAEIERGREFSPAYVSGSYLFTPPGRELASASGSSSDHDKGGTEHARS